MKIVFMGTPDFAACSLETLVKAGHEIELVVTKPDCYRGKKAETQYSAVKEMALKYNLPIFQPAKVKAPENVAELKKYNPDVIVVIAYGQLLSQEILDIPKICCVNVHASLLPKYRGAAPIQWAVLNGDKVTGVTTMRMDIGMDTGDIIMQEEMALADDETSGSLFDKLMVKGGEVLLKTLSALEDGTATFTKQNESEATHTTMITKDMGNIDFNESGYKLSSFVRGMTPWPSAYTTLKGKKVKIFDLTYMPDEDANGKKPGDIILANKNELKVRCKDGFLLINELQLEGKKRMRTEEFLRGFKIEESDHFGNDVFNV